MEMQPHCNSWILIALLKGKNCIAKSDWPANRITDTKDWQEIKPQ
jgi:hypothetical protein